MSILYLKNEKVLELESKAPYEFKVNKILNKELLPFPLLNECTTETFSRWLGKRRIPAKREGLDELKKNWGEKWLEPSNYASLTDQYWINLRDEKWESVNFFDNVYSCHTEQMFFSPWELKNLKPINIKSNSPDLTTGGVVRKTWKQMNKRDPSASSLIKAASARTHQEPLNEVLVAVFAEQLGEIPCVPYNLYVEGTEICSICDNFVTKNTELITAADFFYLEPKEESVSTMDHLLTLFEKYDVPNMEEFLKWMIFIDNITANSDRHLSNIGVIRDVDTRKFLGPAPLFDSASAFWNNYHSFRNRRSQLFPEDESKIMRSFLNKKDVMKVFYNPTTYEFIRKYPSVNPERKEALIRGLKEKELLLDRGLAMDRTAI